MTRRAARRRPPPWGRAGGDLLAFALLAPVLLVLLLGAATLPPSAFSAAADQLPDNIALRGFYDPERNEQRAFRWTKPEAALAIPLAAPGDYRLTLTLQDSAAAPPGRPIAFRANGDPAGGGELATAPRDYTVALRVSPDRWATTEDHVALIELATPAFAPPGDPRLLGANLVALSLAPERPANPWQPALLLAPLALLLAIYGAARAAGASVITATIVSGALIAAYGFLLLGGRRGAFAVAALPGLRPRATALLLVALATVTLAIRLVRRARLAPTTIEASARRRDVILFAALLVCYSVFLQKAGWNENSRFDLIRAIVDDRSTSIDPYHENTDDKSFANGHFRSDKAPGSALLGVPVYTLLRAVGSSLGLATEPERLLAPVTLAVSGVSIATLALLLARWLRPRVGANWALALSAGCGLATLLLPFATVLFGHAAAACALFAPFALLTAEDRPATPRRLLAVGFLLGWGVLIEFPVALGAAIILAYAAWRDRRAVPWIVAGGLPPALILLGYNQLAFGTPLTIGYAHLTNAGSASGMGRGFLGVSMPTLGGLRAILIGPVGLLRLAPWLLAALVGLRAAWAGARRAEAITCAAIVGGFLLYNAAYFDPLGGRVPGPRFLVPALPFAVALVGFVAPRWRAAVGALLVPAACLLLAATATEPEPTRTLADPLADLWLPRLLNGQLGQNTPNVYWGLRGWQVPALLALLALVALAAYVLAARPGRWPARLSLALTALLLIAALGLGLPRG